MSSPDITLDDVRKALQGVQDPESGKDIGQREQIKSVSCEANVCRIEVGIATHSLPVADDFREKIAERLKQKFSQISEWNIEWAIEERAVPKLGQIGLTARSVIAVGSGKGGVGKSTISTSIALALHKMGSRVGLLDTDVYGPSVPQLLGLSGQPAVVDNRIEPIDFDGMPVMSIGFLVPADQAVIWRGPMLHKYVGQFLGGTKWGELDYLVIDMPPGTGDIALSLSQMLPITGSVIVCTPQDVALADAIKAVGMLNQVKIPILGVVENMSGFVCPDCNKEYDIFGKGGAKEYAENQRLPFLGELPITIPLRERGDQGRSSENFDDPQLAPYLNKIAYQLVRTISDATMLEPPKPQLPVLG